MAYPSIEGGHAAWETDLSTMRLPSYLRLVVPTALAGLAVGGGAAVIRMSHSPGSASATAAPLVQKAAPTKLAAAAPTHGSTAPRFSRPGLYSVSSRGDSSGPIAFDAAPTNSGTRDFWSKPVPPASTPADAGTPSQPPPSWDDGTDTTPTQPTTTTTATTPSLPPIEIADVHEVWLSPFAATVAWRTSEPVSSRIAYGVDALTLWTAPAEASYEHVATLSGLRFGTSYRLAVEARAVDGRTQSAEFVLNTPRTVAGVTASIEGGAFRVNGQPFFPTIVWSACADTYETQLAAGIDLFMGNGCGTARDQLDQLGGRALSVTDARGPAVEGPGLAGSFLPDEWDLHLPGSLGFAEAADLATTSAPGPRFLTLSNHFYSRAEPLPQGRGLYGPLAANAEVLGFDIYPLQNWCRWDSFADVFDAQQELDRLGQGKPTFQWIEARTMDCHNPILDPTPETVRAETWLAIAGGARGIGYFPYDWSPEVGAEITREKREIETLVPALTGAALPASVEHGFVRVGAREHNGAIYVIAVNPSRVEATDTIQVPALGSRPIASLDGTRSVTPADGAFTDTFAPLEVHIYIAAPTA
jgi:hypothetical protein